MLLYQNLPLTLVQLLLCILLPAASNPINTPPPPSLLPKHPPSKFIFPSNSSLSNPNNPLADSFIIAWPETGSPIGYVKLYDYTIAISEEDVRIVLDVLAAEYHNKPPREHCGTLRRSYSCGTVTLVLEPSPDLTWGILAKSMFALPFFMSWNGYVGLSFQIRDRGREVYASGYIIG